MAKPINAHNVELLSFKFKEPPFFEVVGNPERKEIQEICRTLINYGASPMLWGDRDIPDFLAKVGKGFALVDDNGERKLVDMHNIKIGQKTLCLQTYRTPLNAIELKVLRRCSLFLYGLDGELDELRYSPEQKESMKRRMLSSFNPQIAKCQGQSNTRPSFVVGDEIPPKVQKVD
jgi:hypothetical protein